MSEPVSAVSSPRSHVAHMPRARCSLRLRRRVRAVGDDAASYASTVDFVVVVVVVVDVAAAAAAAAASPESRALDGALSLCSLSSPGSNVTLGTLALTALRRSSRSLLMIDSFSRYASCWRSVMASCDMNNNCKCERYIQIYI